MFDQGFQPRRHGRWIDYALLIIGLVAGIGVVALGIVDQRASGASDQVVLAAASRIALAIVFAAVMMRYFDLLLEWFRRDRAAQVDLEVARRDAGYLRAGSGRSRTAGPDGRR